MFRMLVHPSSEACDILWIYFVCCIALVRCVLVLRCGSAGVVCGIIMQAEAINMFRMLVHPSSGACDLFVELFHVLYCSGTMCVGVSLWFGWGGVVSGCRLQH